MNLMVSDLDFGQEPSLEPNLDPYALAKALSGRHLIGGKLVQAASGKTFEVIYPATGEIIGFGANGDAEDVNRAVEDAAAAQKSWGKMRARDRGKLLYKCAEALEEHVEELGRLIALETGKALRTESRVEASILADAFHFHAGLGSELKGETVPHHPDMLTITVREPIGVVGAIIPWNVPLLLMALKIAPAMLAGNTVVVKSAEEAPLTVLRVCQIMNAILPPGVFNMLSGFGPECGAPLVEHPKVGKVTFTGSVETGKIVYKTAADKLIPVTLELGGKSPMIIMADANIDKALNGAVVGMRFTRQGQSCTAASRIFVHDSLYDTFVEKLRTQVDAMVMGDPLDEKTDIGTIISPDQFKKVTGYIEHGKSEPGAKPIECSAMPTDEKFKDGLFVRPVLFTEMTNDSKLSREEIFGPVTCIIRWTDLDEVVKAANDTEYGLAATLWTNDLHAALNVTEKLEAGFVQVNQNLVVQPGLSYGGVKSSGLGKEATLEAMLDHFTHKKTVIFNKT